jgi:pimeloyl-ACP methyl ester carboxylesterase
MKKVLTSSFLCLTSLVLCQCGGGIKVREVQEPIRSMALSEKAEASETDKELYKSVLKEIEVARKWEKRDPRRAIGLYLEAAHRVYLYEDSVMLPLYNHAVGQVADLLNEQGLSEDAVFEGVKGRYDLQIDSSMTNTYPQKSFDDLIPVDCLKRRGLRSEVSQVGVGAPMVALHGTRGENENPFISPVGGDFNLTAVLDFSEKGEAVLRFYDVSRAHEVAFWGQIQPLNINLSASYYVAADRKINSGGASKIMGVFRPARYSDRMGLYLEQRYDPEKIPLILVHGLVSSPMTWVDPMNELFSDPTIRAKYQGYTYYYPTGFPVRMTGGKLKQDLTRLQNYARANGGGKQADRMVIFGHSMGGLLTSVNVREINESTWSELSEVPIDSLNVSQQIKEDYQVLFEQPQVEGIKRAVFFSTPHRGSNMANAWYGSFISLLIDIPNKFVQLDLAGMTQSMTDLGRTVFNQDGPVNSMITLKAGNPVLDFVAEKPILPRVTYHSVIGDRGKGDTPNSSDGVVPYWSSHIDGAESELIVPSGHSSHRDPKAIKEMRRILLEHLENNP